MKIAHITSARLAGAAFIAIAASIVGAQAAPDVKDTAAPPAVSADPQNTSATYGDWVLRCSRGPAPTTQRVCEIVQSFQIQGQQGLFAQMAVGRMGPTDPLKITVVMQPNVSFPSGVKLALDEKDASPVMLEWKRCLPSGCFADAELKDDQIKRWRTQTGTGRLEFKDGGDQNIPLPFSFRGLPQALDALVKS